ncbi:hypothetical protein AMECASPLE_008480 [Ameca splendens]|uniref:Uncharacterized protein n=1 Tax=Ameca splendens TaxID=208324 RepID=A0ABV0YYN0_9TELE
MLCLGFILKVSSEMILPFTTCKNVSYKWVVFVACFCTGAVSQWVEDIEKHSLARLSPVAINTILNVSDPSATAKITVEEKRSVLKLFPNTTHQWARVYQK